MQLSNNNDKRTVEMVFRRNGGVWVGAHIGQYTGEYSEAIELDKTQALRLAENIIKFHENYKEPAENGLYYTNRGILIEKIERDVYFFVNKPESLYTWSQFQEHLSEPDYPLTKFNQESFQALFDKATQQ